jgi:hypothetical protein
MNTRTIRAVAVAVAVGLVVGAYVEQASAAPYAATKGCRKQITTQGRSYAKKRLTYLLNCVDKLLKCEVLAEVDNTNQNSCRSLAEDSCNKRLGAAADSAISKAQASFDTKATSSCVLVGLADMLSTGAGGLWYQNDASCNGSGDVPTLIECLRGEVEQEVDQVVGQVKPRAGILLANMGLGDEFPNLPLPPTVTVVISATGAGTGVLVSPGTINVPAGSALRIEGDPATLPCGMGPGQNGKLDVTVGAQTFTLKEPYGPSRFALLGPFISAGTIPYTIDLKDGSCDDTVTGDVNVP